MDTCMMGNVNVGGDGFARVGRERVMYHRGERIEKVKEQNQPMPKRKGQSLAPFLFFNTSVLHFCANYYLPLLLLVKWSCPEIRPRWSRELHHCPEPATTRISFFSFFFFLFLIHIYIYILFFIFYIFLIILIY